VSSVRYSASIRPAAQVDVSFKVGGYIESIAQVRDASGQWRHLQAGDVVHQGAVLARVRQSDYVARVNEAKSQHGEARSALETNNAQLQEAEENVLAVGSAFTIIVSQRGRDVRTRRNLPAGVAIVVAVCIAIAIPALISSAIRV
jgi:multidrug resistance efflux pump